MMVAMKREVAIMLLDEVGESQRSCCGGCLVSVLELVVSLWKVAKP